MRPAWRGSLPRCRRSRPTIQSAGNQIADTIAGFEDLDAKGELESAFKDADDCKTLTAGS